MATITSSSMASAVGVNVTNEQFVSSPSDLPRKLCVIATYDPSITTVVDNVPVLITSTEAAEIDYGAGFMAARLIKYARLGSGNMETWLVPQPEPVGAVAAEGTLTVTGDATSSGTVRMYINGETVPVSVASGDTDDDIADALAAAITADPSLPITAEVDGVVTNQVNFVVKSKGAAGSLTTIMINLFDEPLPVGVAVAVAGTVAGVGVPDINDALEGIGLSDSSNEKFFTEIVHGYGQDEDTLDALSEYNGTFNQASGCYNDLVSRPFRSIVGDVTNGSGSLSDLLTLADSRRLDRTNGIIAIPGSPHHINEIGAYVMGVTQRVTSLRAAESFYGQPLPHLIGNVGGVAWHKDYTNRDTAVKGGIGVVKEINGVCYLQNLLTFCRPATIPVDSNVFKSQRNIGIMQNILNAIRVNFEQDRWLGCFLVSDVSKVTNIVDRQKARDTEAVKDDLIALANGFMQKGWVYDVENYTIPNIEVSIRSGTNGFDIVFPVILSGEINIVNTELKCDASITVLL